MSNKVKFTIECEMEERWVDQFLSFLSYMQMNGVQGNSEIVGFYSDGDGDFKPKFCFEKLNFEWNYAPLHRLSIYSSSGVYLGATVFWDAG